MYKSPLSNMHVQSWSRNMFVFTTDVARKRPSIIAPPSSMSRLPATSSTHTFAQRPLAAAFHIDQCQGSATEDVVPNNHDSLRAKKKGLNKKKPCDKSFCLFFMPPACACLRLPWGWIDVGVRDGSSDNSLSEASRLGISRINETITKLDRVFVAKDVRVLYSVAAALLAMIWALIICMYSVQDLQDSRDTVVTVFCLGLDVIAFVYAVRRIWILKFDMVHPALRILGQVVARRRSASASATASAPQEDLALSQTAFAYNSLADREGGIMLTNMFLAIMVTCMAIGILGFAAASACLLGRGRAVAAGIGLAAASSVAFVLSVLFYRKHAGVHLQHINTELRQVFVS
jgi:hypothetical protein